MTRTSVVDEIVALMPRQSGFRPWYERVNVEQEKLLEAIISGWRSGRFGTTKNTAAKAISKYLERHGIKIGRQGVIAWLTKNNAT